MAARILRVAPPARHAAADPRPKKLGQGSPRFRFWFGASGRRYVHTIHPLLECPTLPEANYLLVRRHDDGTRTVLHIGHTTNPAPSLNLAHIRQKAATLGANEVHVHLLTATESQRRLIECDLRAAVFGTLGAEPDSTTLH
jgi:hypothetical protein